MTTARWPSVLARLPGYLALAFLGSCGQAEPMRAVRAELDRERTVARECGRGIREIESLLARTR